MKIIKPRIALLSVALFCLSTSCATKDESASYVSNYAAKQAAVNMSLVAVDFHTASASASFRTSVLPLIMSCAWENSIGLNQGGTPEKLGLKLVFSEETYIKNFASRYSISATAIVESEGKILHSVVLTRETDQTLASYSSFALLCADLFAALSAEL